MTRSKNRFIYMICTGIFITLLFRLILHPRPDRDGFEPKHHPLLVEMIAISIVTVIIWEGNLQIDNWLNKQYSWLKETRKRLTLQFAYCTVYTVTMLTILIMVAHFFIDRDDIGRPHGMDPHYIPAIFIAITILLAETGVHFFNSWKQSIFEMEKYKTESANAQLQNLKNQLNPHFLFNNLSVLTSLIYINQDKAVSFINELSKVYRYTLDSKNAELVSLKEELDFLYHYIYLLKIRFDSSISFNFNVDSKKMNAFLPPMCLQMLVENTIQHNEASQAKPLNVSIFTADNFLIIQNQLQKRSDVTESSGIGLRNIQMRYSYFTDDKIEISNDGSKFMVSLPLIKQK